MVNWVRNKWRNGSRDSIVSIGGALTILIALAAITIAGATLFENRLEAMEGRLTTAICDAEGRSKERHGEQGAKLTALEKTVNTLHPRAK